jgi:acetyl esterase/lipase
MLHQRIELWDKEYLASHQITGTPVLDTYLLDGDRKRGAVLICPGGGYGFTSSREAEPIAMQFIAAGYHAFVLYYSVAPNRHPQPLRDVSRSICLIRDYAEEWKVIEDNIAVCGFSAGGHLTASIGVHWDKQQWVGVPGIEVGRNRPNALILSYPVISSGEFAHQGSFNNLLGTPSDAELLEMMSLEKQVSASTPPTFIWHTVSDNLVPVENALLFAHALQANHVPFEMHIYPDGPHGYSLANKETNIEIMESDDHVATWMSLCLEWLDHIWHSSRKTI